MHTRIAKTSMANTGQRVNKISAVSRAILGLYETRALKMAQKCRNAYTYTKNVNIAGHCYPTASTDVS